MKNKFLILSFTLIALLLLRVASSRFIADEKEESKELTKIVPTTHVIRTSLSQTLTLSAELVPYNEATLYAKVPGYLKKINVDIGKWLNAS